MGGTNRFWLLVAGFLLPFMGFACASSNSNAYQELGLVYRALSSDEILYSSNGNIRFAVRTPLGVRAYRFGGGGEKHGLCEIAVSEEFYVLTQNGSLVRDRHSINFIGIYDDSPCVYKGGAIAFISDDLGVDIVSVYGKYKKYSDCVTGRVDVCGGNLLPLNGFGELAKFGRVVKKVGAGDGYSVELYDQSMRDVMVIDFDSTKSEDPIGITRGSGDG